MTAPRLFTSAGPVHLAERLGQGGEGAVYAIEGRRDLVAKVYHAPPASTKAEKLGAMVSMRTDELLKLAAWPVDGLRDGSGSLRGLVMPRIQDHRDVHELYSPKSRKIHFPKADWRFLVRTALNTARAFAAVHQTGCVIGDVNQGGVTVSSVATVKLIDCDSFQVRHGGRLYKCEVGTPLYTPPELQQVPLSEVERTPNHDNFGLAVLLFHLLFLGRHPFAGKFQLGEMPIERAISEYRFAFGAHRLAYKMEPPPHVPQLQLVSSGVASFFEVAFSPAGRQPGQRPAAAHWVAALERLEKELVTCDIFRSHSFHRELKGCPWCAIEAGLGFVLFGDGNAAALDISEVWAKILGVPDPAGCPLLLTRGQIPAPVVDPRARESSRAGCLAGLFSWIVTDPRREFDAARTQARVAWEAAMAQWIQQVGDGSFSTERAKLQKTYDDLRQLPSVRAARIKELERQGERLQREKWLARHTIAKARISNIGPSRVATLQAYGIDTALDVVERDILQVPGFGPALTAELMYWRGTVERGFVFNPRLGVDPQDIAAVDRALAPIKRDLEHRLLGGAASLSRIRQEMSLRRAEAKARADAALTALVAAEANHKAAYGNS